MDSLQHEGTARWHVPDVTIMTHCAVWLRCVHGWSPLDGEPKRAGMGRESCDVVLHQDWNVPSCLVG